MNRRELRKQVDHRERPDVVAPEKALGEAPLDKQRVAKVSGAPRIRKVRAKKTPPRLFARWGLFDASMKQVAIFDYNQRASADANLADLLAKKKGSHFLQIVKEAIPEPAPAAPTPVA
jgi:hypothetical protein